MRPRRSCIASVLVLATLGAHTRAARADSQLSLRGAIGPGVGTVGLGGRVGAGGELWLADELAVGAQAALSRQSSVTVYERQEKASGWVLGPVLAWRPRASNSYFVATLGAGYASSSREVRELGPTFCWDTCPARPSPVVDHYRGYWLGAAMGWLTHLGRDGGLELGALLRADRSRDFRGDHPADLLFTLNLELGLAVQLASVRGEGPPLQRLEL